MRELLGLSLTANRVVWTLVDPVDGTITAEDVIDVETAEQVATAAANGVEPFASQTERDIHAVRIAWSKGTAGSALKLTSTLRSLGFRDIDLVSEDEARHSRNRTARYIDPRLELAYGAARTVRTEDHNKPLSRMAARLPARRISLAVAGSVVVLAASTAAAGYMSVGQVPPQAADHPQVAPAPPPIEAPVVVVPAAVQPPPPVVPAAVQPPPAAEVAFVPPAALAPAPVEAAAPTITEQPEAAAAPETAAFTSPVPAPPRIAGPAHLTQEAPSTGPTAAPASAPSADTEPALDPTAPVAVAGQPHLSPEALSTRPLPGPAPLMSFVAAPAPPSSPPPPPPKPFSILSALP